MQDTEARDENAYRAGQTARAIGLPLSAKPEVDRRDWAFGWCDADQAMRERGLRVAERPQFKESA